MITKEIININFNEYPFDNFTPDKNKVYRIDSRSLDTTCRKSGSTTLLADAYIQLLFRGAEIEIRDHYDYIQSHRLLGRLILRRLKSEHPHVCITPSLSNLTIKIIKI